jgi:hypothetical protein
MLRIDLEVGIAPGRSAGRASTSLEVMHRDRQVFDGQVARVAHGDERAAVRHELLQLLHAGVADAAAIFGLIAGVGCDDVARVLIGDDDRVELLAELAGADVGVVDRRQVELCCSSTSASSPRPCCRRSTADTFTRGAWNGIVSVGTSPFTPTSISD